MKKQKEMEMAWQKSMMSRNKNKNQNIRDNASTNSKDTANTVSGGGVTNRVLVQVASNPKSVIPIVDENYRYQYQYQAVDDTATVPIGVEEAVSSETHVNRKSHNSHSGGSEDCESHGEHGDVEEGQAGASEANGAAGIDREDSLDLIDISTPTVPVDVDVDTHASKKYLRSNGPGPFPSSQANNGEDVDNAKDTSYQTQLRESYIAEESI